MLFSICEQYLNNSFGNFYHIQASSLNNFYVVLRIFYLLMHIAQEYSINRSPPKIPHIFEMIGCLFHCSISLISLPFLCYAINFFYNFLTLVEIKMGWPVDRSNDERPPTFNLNFAKNGLGVARRG